MDLIVKSVTGEEILPFFNAVAALRMEVFRAFPYLYEGSMEEEKEYLHTFFQAENSVLIVALHKENVIGASTGLPMIYETPNVQKPFIEAKWPIESIFYFGESVLLKAFRGKGIGVKFFEHREAYARSLDQIDVLTFCSVERAANHPLRPPGYQGLDGFWRNRGFQPTDMTCQMYWKDISEITESAKSLRFWTKKIK